MTNGRLLTSNEIALLRDMAAMLNRATRERRGIDTYVLIRKEWADEWAKRLTEIAGE